MKNSGTHTQHIAVERNNQLVLLLNSEIKLPEDAPVRVASAQLEELDYRKLHAAYSSRGRKSVTDPRVIFKVMAYGYQCGIFSSRKLEKACQYRADFMWLLENQKVPDHATLLRAESCIVTRNPHRCRTGFRSPVLGIAVKAARIVHRGSDAAESRTSMRPKR